MVRKFGVVFSCQALQSFFFSGKIMSKALPFRPWIERSEALVVPLRTAARLAFSLTIILIPFRFRFVLASRPLAPVYGDFTDFLLYASDITLLAALLLWALSLLIRPYPIKFGPVFIRLPLAGIFIFSFISTFTSLDAPLSIYHLIRLIMLGGFYLYIVNEIERLSQLAIPIALQVLIQSLIGVTQYLSQRSLGLQGLGEWALDPAWSGVSVVWADGVRALRAYGLADHPNILGGSLAFGLLLLAGWAVRSASRRSPLMSGIFALGLVAVFLTFSRAAWLGLAVGMLILVVGLRRTRQNQALFAWLGLAGAGLILLLPFVWQNASFLGVRLNVGDSFTQITIEQRSISERRELNNAANQIFMDHPLDGVGIGAFPTALLSAQPDVPYDYQPPHFALLQVAAEVGIFGALFYFLLLAAPWAAVWMNYPRIDFSPAFLAACAALAAITIVGLFDYYPWLLAPGRLWQILILGFWGLAYQQSLDKTDRESKP